MSIPFHDADVSRETLERLEIFHDLLVKWNATINLVSKSSIDHIWNRHIWDSHQLMALSPVSKIWLDIGSGGGFPGLVIAICAKESDPDRRMLLVESDSRKCAFLRTVIRELDLRAEVLTRRIEELAPVTADVLSARALADLDHLLNFSERHLHKNGTALFPKGETWEKEVEAAHESWSFDCKAHKSKTSPAAVILEIKEIARV